MEGKWIIYYFEWMVGQEREREQKLKLSGWVRSRDGEDFLFSMRSDDARRGSGFFNFFFVVGRERANEFLSAREW